MQITFDDEKTLADFNMVVLKGYEKSLMPSISGNTTNIPGRIGSWDNGDELGTTVDTYGISSLTQDPIRREYELRQFNRYITDDFGYPREIKVVLSDEPHLYFMAKIVKPKAPKRYNSGSDFELTLNSNDPRRYSRFKSDEVVWGSKVIDFHFPYTLGRGGVRNNIQISKPTALDIMIDGYNVKPVIRIQGTGTAVTIMNKNQVIRVPNFVNSNLIIDCQRYVLIKNGVEGFIDFNDFILFGGENRVSISGVNLNFKLSIDYRDEY